MIDRVTTQRAMTAPVLEIDGLRKAFGAVVATDNVSLTVRPGELHALIGPNGAGKSTLITQICGELAPNAGRIVFAGRDITALPAYARARLGLGRSFQLTQLCPEFSARDNVMLSIEAKGGGSFNMFANPRRNARLRDAAQDWLDRVGLAGKEDRAVMTLGHGEQRQLEIAMVLATDPRVILLDEPLAGMGQSEARRVVDLIASLKAERAVLIVEHDMDAVFELADRLTVMADGRVIASGRPADVRKDAAVRAAYLSEEDDA